MTKLSTNQIKVLAWVMRSNFMGDLYYPVGKNERSAYALQRLGFVAEVKRRYLGKGFEITPAGRAALAKFDF